MRKNLGSILKQYNNWVVKETNNIVENSEYIKPKKIKTSF